MKKEYEKLQRKYTKQSKDSRRMKEDVLCEISGSKTEINKLKDQLEVCLCTPKVEKRRKMLHNIIMVMC